MQHKAPQHVVVSDEQHWGPSRVQATLHPKVLCTAERSDDVSQVASPCASVCLQAAFVPKATEPKVGCTELERLLGPLGAVCTTKEAVQLFISSRLKLITV